MQPKNVTFPTDAKLLETAIQQLGKLAKDHGVPLRQSYGRLAKRAAMMAGRYAHAKQFKRMNRELKFLRTRLGRLNRDIRRKIDGDEGLQEIFAVPLSKASSPSVLRLMSRISRPRRVRRNLSSRLQRLNCLACA